MTPNPDVAAATLAAVFAALAAVVPGVLAMMLDSPALSGDSSSSIISSVKAFTTASQPRPERISRCSHSHGRDGSNRACAERQTRAI